MYKSIHVSAGNSIFKINADGPASFNKRNSGKVTALLRRGNQFSAPFGGFIEAGNIIGLQRVKLINVKHLCTDADAEVVEYVIHKNHYVVGTYRNQRLYILLFEGQPKHYKVKDIVEDGKNNVIDLF
ncbi:hypothetical protein [Vibrio bivalvicida]|uniref:Uncharacterized protein n=1 Tax=Vibrio bivalvicida TaxID=1276888 RepID=A0A177Y2V1_9VIBR|nr:hypothetical protein [Vibrio bivalvicida]OAJ95213.1 hypothetical protein APB76_07990 [Vibrio bivalvicida]